MTPLKIMHVLSQRQEMTGSGIYLEAIMRESHKHGVATYRVAAVPIGSIDPSMVPAGQIVPMCILNRSLWNSLYPECPM